MMLTYCEMIEELEDFQLRKSLNYSNLFKRGLDFSV